MVGQRRARRGSWADVRVVPRTIGCEMTAEADALRAQILDLVNQYHKVAFPDRPFLGGISNVPVSGKVFDGREMTTLVDAALDFWLTTGRYAEQFEREFARV